MFSKWKEKISNLKNDIITLYLAFKDPRISILPKIIIGLTVSYALSPIDLIPDFIPVIGYLDDLLLLPLGIIISIKLIPNEILNELREKAKDLQEPKKNKIAGVVIILLWIAVIFLLIKYYE